MESLSIAIGISLWLGILTAISPCPLAANIAAITYISRSVSSVGNALKVGLFYTLGRALAYAALGIILARGVLATPQLSHFLQKYMNLFMGPILILVAMVLLKLITLPTGGGLLAWLQTRVPKQGFLGALLLGALFALSFCPVSAALFFGTLLPLALRENSALLLPILYGIATGIPVLIFSLIITTYTNRLGALYTKTTLIELSMQRLTGIVFLVVGLYFTITLTLRF